jgi:hypothetical protein
MSMFIVSLDFGLYLTPTDECDHGFCFDHERSVEADSEAEAVARVAVEAGTYLAPLIAAGHEVNLEGATCVAWLGPVCVE